MKHGIDFEDETINRLFGHEAAEDEDPKRLQEYYFKSTVYNHMMADLPIRLLVGHKGIGKSALFQIAMAEESKRGGLPIMIRPDDIAEIAIDQASFLQTVRDWKIGLNQIISRKVLNSIGLNDESTLARIAHSGGRIVNFLVDSLKTINTSIQLNPTQQLVIERFLKNHNITVYVDDLDRGWTSTKQDINRISALLNAVRDICNDNSGLHFKISLRSDVYFLVRTSDESTDKIEGSVVWHSWMNHEILVLLIKRIETFFGRAIDENHLSSLRQSELAHYLDSVMEPTFSGSGKWENKRMYKILMSLIRKRPRDLVKLCTLAARNARNTGNRLILTPNFKAVFEEYSQGRIQDTINEFRSELPDIERLIFGMKPSKKAVKASESYSFNTPELRLKLNNIIEHGAFRFYNGKVATAKDLAHFLYKINFLTARKELPSKEIQRKDFEENRYLMSETADFGYDWEIHPAYRWALQPDTIDDIFRNVAPSADDDARRT